MLPGPRTSVFPEQTPVQQSRKWMVGTLFILMQAFADGAVMAKIAVVLAFVCACASLCAAISPPPYVESLRNLEGLEEHITEHLLSMDDNVPAVTDYRRHYAVIMAHIGEFAKWLASTCLLDYENDYMRDLAKNIPLGFTQPQYVVDKAKYYLSLVKDKSQKLIRLIKSDCAPNEPAAACNVVIDSDVKGDPERYKDDAEVLLLVGETASHYLRHADEMVSSSQDFMAISYLVKNMNALKDFLFSGDHLFKKLNDMTC